MILSDKDLKSKLNSKEIIITSPHDDHLDNLNSSSIDFRLSNHFLIYKNKEQRILDPKEGEELSKATELLTINDPEKGLILQAGEFILGTTLERLKLADHIVANLQSRNSLEKLGLTIGSSSKIEAGYEGTLSLALKNNNNIPIVLYPGMRICQISFAILSSKAEIPYYSDTKNKYQGQELPLASKIHQEF